MTTTQEINNQQQTNMEILKEKTSTCIDGLGKIPKSTLTGIIERLSKVKEKKEKKPKDTSKGPSKSRSLTKPFEVQVTEEMKEEYNLLVTRIKKNIGTLSFGRLVNFGEYRCALADSLTGMPCKFMCWSIPTDQVGILRAENIRANDSYFLGSFSSELSMFCYLLKVLSLPRDHVMVLQTAEYYGISLANKYSEETVSSFYESIRKSKLGNDEDSFNAIPMPGQLGRSAKSLRNVFFYRNGPLDHYDSSKRFIDCPKLLSLYNCIGGRFYDYREFCDADRQARNRKSRVQATKAEWENHVANVGIEQALKDFEELKKKRAMDRQITNLFFSKEKVTGIKRNNSNNTEESIKKPRLVDENGNETSSSTDLSNQDEMANFYADLSAQIPYAKDYFQSGEDSSDCEESSTESESDD